MSEAYSSDNMESGGGLIAYLPSMLWQRRWWIAVPFVLLTLAGLLAAFLLPASYRSSALLLVESPQLPSELVGDKTGTSVIDKRIAKVRQQVLSRPDLIELIENNNLYSEERQAEPLSEVLDKMRKATNLTPVTADIGNAGNGSNTIAFSLTYDYPDAQKAQLVAQDFVERLLRIDTTQTAEQAAGTVEFLQDQANNLSGQISTLENQIGRIKAVNGGALSNANTMMLPSSGGGYQSQIAGLQRDNAQLQAQIKLQATAIDRDPQVAAAEAALAGAKAIYSDNHPDVRAAQQRLAEARRLAQRTVSNDNIAGTLRSQIASNNAAIAQLSSAQSSDSARSSAIVSAQARAPAVNEQIAQLQARADGLRANYQTVSTNLINARGAARLSEQQKGERLSIIDPPVVPDRPDWPNRPLLIVGGMIAGLGIGFGLALLLELVLQPVRGVASLQQIIGEPPLVIVPKMGKSARTARRSWRDRLKLRLPRLGRKRAAPVVAAAE